LALLLFDDEIDSSTISASRTSGVVEVDGFSSIFSSIFSSFCFSSTFDCCDAKKKTTTKHDV
jgi:hypothetical protein